MSSQNLRPPSDESLEHRSLSQLEGLWKVVHHGNLITAVAPEKTPRLVIYFRKLVNQGKPTIVADFETQGPAIPISVPAAELMRLPLNVLIRNSRIARNPCLPLPSEEFDTLEVDVDKSKVKFINRKAQAHGTDKFIIPFNENRSPSLDSPGGKAYYVAIEYNGDPFGIIIPCAEVFRFFYCTSSRMLYTILSDKILDVDRYIIDPARSGTIENDPEVVVVWLRQWMVNSDRRHIARLFFTEGAFEEAKKIFLRAGGYVDGGAFERALIALPPRHGKMSLKCIFKKVLSDGRERIFVTRLISASNWTLPFREIHFGRDNDGRRVATDNERENLPDHERPQRPGVLAEGAEIGVLEDEVSDNSIDPVELRDTEFESRFPDLDKIYSPQVEKTNQTTKNNKGKKVLPLANGSLVEGTPSEHEGLVNTILQAMDKAAEIDQENKEKNGRHTEPLMELEIPRSTKLHERIEHLKLAIIHEVYVDRLEVDFLQILDQLGLVQGTPVNILPDSIDGKSPTWLFWDKKQKHPRPVLIARITLDGRVRYMIDFMHQEGKRDTASLLIWHSDELQINDRLLEYAIRTCMRNRAVNLKHAELLRDYSGNSIKHTFSDEGTLPKQVQLIEKVFSAENRMNKWIVGNKLED